MSDADPRREAAIKRLEAKRAFNLHVALYVLVNGLLIVIWAFSGRGYFWPIWPIAGWGIAIAIHYWSAFKQKPITEDDIHREIQRGG
ncbi:MAG: 2TM domain-containing protein [Roseiarcus sp.]